MVIVVLVGLRVLAFDLIVACAVCFAVICLLF